MTRKILAILISLICLLGVFAGALAVGATSIQPKAPENSEAEVTTAAPTTTEDADFGEVSTPTAAPTTSSQVVKPLRTTKPVIPTRPASTTRVTSATKVPSSSTTTTRATTSASTTATSTDAPLPDGSFYVYLERNNGERRLKRVMEGEGLVPQPSDPVRKGYVFDGWYADPDFKNSWFFNSDIAKEGTIIYAKWIPDAGSKQYKITVKALDGGSIEVNPPTATANEYVVINVTPDEGKRLVVGSVTVNGVPTDVLNFLMPAKNVVIDARFEDVPEVEGEEEDRNIIPFIIGAAVLVIIVVVAVAIVSARRRNDITEDDIDENGTIIDDDDDDWYDESITVEDGFKDGEKVGKAFVEDDSDALLTEDDVEDIEE